MLANNNKKQYTPNETRLSRFPTSANAFRATPGSIQAGIVLSKGKKERACSSEAMANIKQREFEQKRRDFDGRARERGLRRSKWGTPRDRGGGEGARRGRRSRGRACGREWACGASCSPDRWVAEGCAAAGWGAPPPASDGSRWSGSPSPPASPSHQGTRAWDGARGEEE